MKTSMTLISLLLLLTLVSCGQKGSNATLSVTKGFTASNSGFDGGLVVFGNNPSTGQKFSYTIASGTSTNINLPNGTWNFYSVGWDGATPMKGNAYCASTSKTLDGNAVSVALNSNQTNCDTAVFIGLNLQVKTCGAFYDTNTPITSANLSTYWSTFCNNVPVDMNGEAKAVKFVALNISPSGQIQESYSSTCEATPANFGTPGFPDIPVNNFPVQLKLFKDVGCTDLLNSINFLSGIQNGNSAADVIAYTSGTQFRIALPANKLMRAYSPFWTMLPQVTCGITSPYNCLAIPALGSIGGGSGTVDNTYYVDWGGSTEIELGLNSSSTCTATITPVASQFIIDSCSIYNGKAYARVKVNAGDTCFSSNVCDLTSVSISEGINTKSGLRLYSKLASNKAVSIVDAIFSSTGNRSANSNHLFFKSLRKRSDDEDNKTLNGDLSNIRQLLGPDGVGGVLFSYNLTTCPLVQGAMGSNRSVTLCEPNKPCESYLIDIINTNATVNNYLCNDSGPNISACTNHTNFDLLLNISKLDSGVYKLQNKIYLKCGAKVGINESKDDRNADSVSLKRLDRSLTFWNTNGSSNQRFEIYSLSQELNSGNSVVKTYSNYRRMEGANLSTAPLLDIRTLGLEMDLVGSTAKAGVEEVAGFNSSFDYYSYTSNGMTGTVASVTSNANALEVDLTSTTNTPLINTTCYLKSDIEGTSTPKITTTSGLTGGTGACSTANRIGRGSGAKAVSSIGIAGLTIVNLYPTGSYFKAFDGTNGIFKIP
ncbi:MAG: hypothetical protein K2P81_06885 [Bacteriovoracaceae bacterium]|nr:hypothetical protein [Bacteriovoracaceae bacterium]